MVLSTSAGSREPFQCFEEFGFEVLSGGIRSGWSGRYDEVEADGYLVPRVMEGLAEPPSHRVSHHGVPDFLGDRESETRMAETILEGVNREQLPSVSKAAPVCPVEVRGIGYPRPAAPGQDLYG